MQQFKVSPATIRHESDRLKALWRGSSEIMDLSEETIRVMESMEGFPEACTALRRTIRKGREQIMGLLLLSRTLVKVAELYEQCELKNIDSPYFVLWQMPITRQVFQLLYEEEPLIKCQPMISETILNSIFRTLDHENSVDKI